MRERDAGPAIGAARRPVLGEHRPRSDLGGGRRGDDARELSVAQADVETPPGHWMERWRRVADGGVAVADHGCRELEDEGTWAAPSALEAAQSESKLVTRSASTNASSESASIDAPRAGGSVQTNA